VQHLAGVTGVTNLITIKPKLSPINIELDIQSAFQRNALFDARKIQVAASGNQVILRGTVRNYAEYEEAERVAWAAPGVYSVDNQIKVDWCCGFSA
jgi:osmotically-inducible protein OsmY